MWNLQKSFSKKVYLENCVSPGVSGTRHKWKRNRVQVTPKPWDNWIGYTECPRNLINPILACSIYRYTPVHTRPALTNQQSFYDSHTSPPYQSPKSSYKPTLEHQESFVAPQSSGLNTFGFMPMRQMLERTSSKWLCRNWFPVYPWSSRRFHRPELSPYSSQIGSKWTVILCDWRFSAF